jgi:hypothetical protein
MHTPVKSTPGRACTPRRTPGRVPTLAPPAAVTAAYERMHQHDLLTFSAPRRAESPTKPSRALATPSKNDVRLRLFTGPRLICNQTSQGSQLAALMATPAPKLNSDVFRTPCKQAPPTIAKTPAERRNEGLIAMLASVQKAPTPALAGIQLVPESFGLQYSIARTPVARPLVLDTHRPPTSSFTPDLAGLRHMMRPQEPMKTPVALDSMRALFVEPEPDVQGPPPAQETALPKPSSHIPAFRPRPPSREEPSTSALTSGRARQPSREGPSVSTSTSGIAAGPRRATRSAAVHADPDPLAIATDPAPRRTAAALRPGTTSSKVPLGPRTRVNSPSQAEATAMASGRLTRSKASLEDLAVLAKPAGRGRGKATEGSEVQAIAPRRKVAAGRVVSGASDASGEGKENARQVASTGGRLTRTRALRSGAR